MVTKREVKVVEDNKYYIIKLINYEKYYAGFAYSGSRRKIIVTENLEEAKRYNHFGNEISGTMQILMGMGMPHKVEIIEESVLNCRS